MKTLWLLAAAVVANMMALQPQDRIRIPDGIVGGRCTLSRTGNSLTRVNRNFLVDCSSADDMVQCDFESAEPLDLSLKDACNVHLLALHKAGVATITGGALEPLTVEWLDFALASKARVVAVRRLDLQSNARILVTKSPDRFIRFSAAGSAPFTVRATDLLDAPVWILPGLRPGGELLARLPPEAIRPESFRLVGPSAVEAAVADDLLHFSGVPPGEYDLVPVYTGGLTGQRQRVTIDNERSLLIVLAAERVGAVQVSADSGICLQAGSVNLTRIVNAGGASTVSDVVSLPMDSGCSNTIAGLRPGDYEASFRSNQGLLATQRFVVASQAISAVRLSGFPVRVLGKVLLNNKPLQAATITFVRVDDLNGQKVTADTDSDGSFEAHLAAPGTFNVAFGEARYSFLGTERDVVLHAGDNVVEWSVRGGAVRVNLLGWDHVTPVTLILRHLQMTKPGLVGDGVRLTASDTVPVVLRGIAYGDYAVQARQHDPTGTIPDRIAGATITLDGRRDEVPVTLELKERRAIVRVVDTNHNPIEDASVGVNGEQLVRSDAPGVFVADDIAPGVRVMVRAPGFTPLCRMIPDDRAVTEIVVDRGAVVQIDYSEGAGLSEPSGFLAWSGSDCKVLLSLFEFRSLSSSSDSTASFLITNFPNGSGMAFVPGSFDGPDKYQPIQQSRDGVVRVSLRKR